MAADIVLRNSQEAVGVVSTQQIDTLLWDSAAAVMVRIFLSPKATLGE